MINAVFASNFVADWPRCVFAHADGAPWTVVGNAPDLIRSALLTLDSDYDVVEEMAVHRTATVERGSVLKGPGIIGPRCFVASGAYLRGGVYLAENCIVGPGSELKTSLMFGGSKLAHLNFVGDSILGAGVNVEAGAVIANYRNELADRAIRIRLDDTIIDTGVEKFGAVVGDGGRIGANAVVAPGALLMPGVKVGRLQLVDHYPY